MLVATLVKSALQAKITLVLVLTEKIISNVQCTYKKTHIQTKVTSVLGWSGKI